MAISEITSPLYQRIGESLYKINLETTAAQVKTADGSDVETKLSSLSSAISGKTKTYVVDDITARDAIQSPAVGDQCWVKDATADPTVSSGAAKYIYESAESKWVKTAEAESMDVVVSWADIQDKPTSTVAQIDAAVSKAHEHANLEDLNKLSVSNGQVAVDGVVLKYVTVVPSVPESAPADLADGGLLIVNA